jgi:hypothetical protein
MRKGAAFFGANEAEEFEPNPFLTGPDAAILTGSTVSGTDLAGSVPQSLTVANYMQFVVTTVSTSPIPWGSSAPHCLTGTTDPPDAGKARAAIE